MVTKLSTAKKMEHKVKITKLVISKEGILSTGHYKPGDMIFTEIFNDRTTGRLQTEYRRERDKNYYHGGIIYQDVTSRLVRVQPQTSM